jgi:DNA-binding LytR/AlgR family response regulator
MKAVIIEDEPKAAQELKEILAQIRPNIVIENVLGSVEESVAWFERNVHPDLIFSDIQLSDGVSFEIYRKVRISSPVIFCTAFDEHMLHAFETNGIAYLLKPIVPAKVEESLQKYDGLRSVMANGHGMLDERIEALFSQLKPSYKSTLLVPMRDKIVPVKADDVAYLYYNNGVVLVCLFDQQQYFIEETMEVMESRLNPSVFYRVNRQFIIHRRSIREIERYFSRKLVVKLSLSTPETLIVSKLKASLFLDWMQAS